MTADSKWRIKVYCGRCLDERSRRPKVIAVVETVTAKSVAFSNPSADARRRVARDRETSPEENTRALESLEAWMGGGGVVFLTEALEPKSGRATVHVHCDVHGDGEAAAPEVGTLIRRARAQRSTSAVLAW